MKRILVIITIIMLIGIAGRIEHTYTRGNVLVVDVNEATTTFKDMAGNIWAIDEHTGLEKNDVVTLKMYDNWTGKIEDDTILKVIKK